MTRLRTRLVFRYRALKVHFNAGPHWWIKPTITSREDRHLQVVGVTFVGKHVVDQPTDFVHCRFTDKEPS